MHFSPVELVIILVIVLVLFGAGRVSKLGGELGTGIREFRKGLNGGENDVKVVTPVDPNNVNAVNSTVDSTSNKPL